MRGAKGVEGAHLDAIWSVGWSEDRIVTGSVDESVCVWSPSLDKQRVLKGNFLGCVSAVASRGRIVASSIDCRIRVWGDDQEEQPLVINAGPVNCWTVAVSNDGTMIATGGKSGVTLFSSVKGDKLRSWPTEEFALDVSFRDNSALAASCTDGSVHVFDLAGGQPIRAYHFHKLPVRTVTWSSDGWLFSGCDDSRVLKYDVRHSAFSAELSRHTNWVTCVRCAPDAKTLATASADRTIKLWDLTTNQVSQTLEGYHSDFVWGLAWEPTAPHRLVSVGDDAKLQLYEPQTTPSHDDDHHHNAPPNDLDTVYNLATRLAHPAAEDHLL